MHPPKTQLLLAIMGLSFSITSLTAQPLVQEYKVLSPANSDTVRSGALFIAIMLPENLNSKNTDYLLLLDGKRDISQFLLLRKNILSVIYSEPLTGGRHYFELFKKPETNEKALPLLVGYFIVLEPPEQVTLVKTLPTKKPTEKKKKPLFSGQINFSTADANISGPGATLRQEPPSVRQIGADLKIRAGKGEVTLKGFYTSNSQGNFNYRNTLNVGFNKNGSSISIGDHFADQDRFTFNGIRVRGVFLDAFFPNTDQKLKIKFMYGNNVDANNAPNNFPQAPDSASNIFQSGIPVYERNFYIFQFYVPRSKNAYGKFSMVRVRDYSNGEIIDGITPKDNMSVSWEKYIPISQNRGYVRLNAAMAFTSFNNTLGGSPFDFLIHLNSSTVPLTFKGAPQCAFGLALSIPITNANDFSVDAKRIGHSYFALANPYMLNNRYVVHAADNLKLYKNRVFITLAYDYMIDNLGKQRPQTRENSSISVSTNLRFSQKLPSLNLGYRYFLGNTYSNLQENYNIKNMNLFGSLQYTLQINPMTYQFVLSRNDMNLISEVMSNNRQEINSISVSATFKNILGVSFQGAQTVNYLAGISLPQQFISASLWYRVKKPNIRIKLTALTNTIEKSSIEKESRKGFQAGLDYGFRKYLNIGISTGYMPFTSFAEERDYLEQYIRIRGSYRF